MTDSDTPTADTTTPAGTLDPSLLPSDDTEAQEPLVSSFDTTIPAEAATSVAPVALPELTGGTKFGGAKHLGLLLDVGVEVAAVVGTRELKLEEVLSIQPGTIIDLDKHAGEPIELYVNGKPIALAEIVVVDGRLGARVVESLKVSK